MQANRQHCPAAQTNNSEYGGADLVFAPLCCLYTDNIILWALAFYRNYGIMNTETAGNLDFSWLPAFFVTNLLLVQCSI